MNALILVDIQNDFMPGGALAVPDGDAVVPACNRIMARFDTVVATQDWHPPDHGSFASGHANKNPGDVVELGGVRQVLWPVHCVQDTEGAALHAGLDRDRIDRIFVKGTNPSIDSYSAFFDNGRVQATGLGDFLKQRGVTDVYVAGLATDYCVKFTALDGVFLNFRVCLLEDCCRGVELQDGDVGRAFDEMKAAGVTVMRSEDLKRV